MYAECPTICALRDLLGLKDVGKSWETPWKRHVGAHVWM